MSSSWIFQRYFPSMQRNMFGWQLNAEVKKTPVLADEDTREATTKTWYLYGHLHCHTHADLKCWTTRAFNQKLFVQTPVFEPARTRTKTNNKLGIWERIRHKGAETKFFILLIVDGAALSRNHTLFFFFNFWTLACKYLNLTYRCPKEYEIVRTLNGRIF